jgi:hypothetical protein
MNPADADRLRRILRALDKALALFRASTTKPTVGDIDAESRLCVLRDALHSLRENARQG